MMEHPFIGDLSELTTEELQEKINSLYSKIQFATRMGNHPLATQILMVIESYKTQYNKKMQEQFEEYNIQTNINIESGKH